METLIVIIVSFFIFLIINESIEFSRGFKPITLQCLDMLRDENESETLKALCCITYVMQPLLTLILIKELYEEYKDKK